MNAFSSRRRAGFTLIELIAVIAIIVVVMTLLVPAFNTLGRASNLSTASALVLDELNLARQTALTRNRLVEVRFYRLRNEADPTLGYRAVRSLISDESGDVMSPLGGLKKLPVSIVAVEDEKFSTLLSDATRPTKASEVENLPDAPATAYRTIRFRPTGGAELSAYTSNNDNWFLTLKNERDPTYPDRPADNFATIQLDPFTGRVRQIRP